MDLSTAYLETSPSMASVNLSNLCFEVAGKECFANSKGFGNMIVETIVKTSRSSVNFLILE